MPFTTKIAAFTFSLTSPGYASNLAIFPVCEETVEMR